MNFLADIGISRTGARIDARHFAVRDGGKKHADHGKQNRGDHVTAGGIVDDAVYAHGRDGLNDDDANDD